MVTSLSGWLTAGLLLIASAAAAQTIEDERRALANAKAQSLLADRRAEQLERQAASQLQQAERVRAEAAAIAARIQSSESQIIAAEARIRLIEELATERRIRLSQKQEPAVRLLAALQIMARRPPGLAIVQPGSTRDLVHVRAVLATMLPVITARTEGLRGEIEAGKKLREDAALALRALNDATAGLETQRARLAQIEAKRRREAMRLTRGAINEQDRAIALGEKALDISELMAEVSAAAQLRMQLESLPGPVLRPVNGRPVARPEGAQRPRSVSLGPYRLPVVGTVVTGLGEVSDSGVRARGLTVSTRPAALVVAPANGRIAFAGPFRGFGNIIIIDHGAGWTTLLTTLDRLDARVGDNVVQGTPVGRAGNDRPTVTIELRRGSEPVDITPLIS